MTELDKAELPQEDKILDFFEGVKGGFHIQLPKNSESIL